MERNRHEILSKTFQRIVHRQDPDDEPASVLREQIRLKRDSDAKLGRKDLPVRIKY